MRNKPPIVRLTRVVFAISDEAAKVFKKTTMVAAIRHTLAGKFRTCLEVKRSADICMTVKISLTWENEIYLENKRDVTREDF